MKSQMYVQSRGAALAVRLMLFAVNLKKKDSRLMYKSELGKKHSEFREGIILTALFAAKKNKFNIFRDCDEKVKSEPSLQTDIKSRKVKIPKTLVSIQWEQTQKSVQNKN